MPNASDATASRLTRDAAGKASRAGSLALVAGGLALDFANTSSGRGGPRHREHLGSASDVATWAAHAGVIDVATRALIDQKLAEGDRGFSALLRDALSLRETVYRIACAVARREQPAEADLAQLSARCAASLAKASIEMLSEGARWRWPSSEPIPETILGPITLSAVGLLREGDPTRLKQCPGEHCGWVFFDMTKNKSRRWCEMSVCGNRAKAKAHYRRLKAEAVALAEVS
jgi:predicted RNA-binding Zn ribbon-like protein